ncbi:MAG: hypothetical protein CMC70_07485 [Flavobacteriaceae bacterium]|nr:hypothetical protein [Flavobacteriaceae bacterium]
MFKKNRNQVKSHKENTPLRSKGDRLGWVSLKEAKSVSLSSVLAEGEVVRVDRYSTPLLVP